MPNVTVYVRNEAWTRILKESKGDPLKAKRKIAQLVHEKYG